MSLNVVLDSTGKVYTSPPIGTSLQCCGLNSANNRPSVSSCTITSISPAQPYPIQYASGSNTYYPIYYNGIELCTVACSSAGTPSAIQYLYNNSGTINISRQGTQITGAMVSV